ncbi:cytochrome P450 [Ephemerocybe angulata]|uniref:Cytochrome P450 n=1 Tax=Ephemerocybe angulata TaxID=980116 RepID=A0A8H6HGM2_9AGAR|nr:cytochrome P450 [Tulosesus angulatus]
MNISLSIRDYTSVTKSAAIAGLPLPPGPRGLPLIGNVLDIPGEEFWEKYKELSDQHGSDVIYLNALGTDIIVLNSIEACRELLDKRSSIYSSRPEMTMMNDLVGFTWHFGFMPYGDKWKVRRKIFQQVFQSSRVEDYRPKIVKGVRNFLVQLLDNPDNFRGHGRLLAGAFILDIAYGIEVKSDSDIYIQQAERGMAAMAAAGTSSYLVDFLPSLGMLPSWFPGAHFKREASAWNRDVAAMPRDCLLYTDDALKCGNARTYTTVSSFATFFLCMIQNPEIQRKAQTAIDEAVSQLGRLPDFTEYRKLPYIDALVREVLRWRPVTPIAVPHAVIEDDVYKGYHIPAGATVLPNAYAIAHDPSVYGPNPAKFDPSRFMNASQTKINEDMPMGYETFGYGRRICPGIQVAVESIWLVAISVLAVFDLRPVEGAREGFVKYSSGMLIHADPFKMRFVPRSQEAVELIRNGVSTL